MRLFPSLLLLSLASCAALDIPGGPEPVRLADPALTEASGLAVSPRDPSFLWLINDSGAKPRIHLATRDGADRGFVTLRGVKNKDWEDLLAFELDGRPYLLVADMGDNRGVRNPVTLHLLEEPELPAPGASLDLTVSPKWSLDFSYEDGPRDAEGIAFDPKTRSLLIISKRTKPPALYSLPLRGPIEGKRAVATRLGPIKKLKIPSKSLPHPHGGQPTAFDISSDGRKAALLTYRGIYVYSRSKNESWLETLGRAPQATIPHSLAQAEALAFTPDGMTLIATSEGRHPELLVIPVP